MSPARRLTPVETRLVDAVRAELGRHGLPAEDAAAALALVESGLAARRPPAPDDAPPDRVPPRLVARAVAGVARPSLRPERDVAAVRVAEATPTDLLRELRQRLRSPFSRRSPRRGRPGRGAPPDRG